MLLCQHSTMIWLACSPSDHGNLNFFSFRSSTPKSPEGDAFSLFICIGRPFQQKLHLRESLTMFKAFFRTGIPFISINIVRWYKLQRGLKKLQTLGEARSPRWLIHREFCCVWRAEVRRAIVIYRLPKSTSFHQTTNRTTDVNQESGNEQE